MHLNAYEHCDVYIKNKSIYLTFIRNSSRIKCLNCFLLMNLLSISIFMFYVFLRHFLTHCKVYLKQKQMHLFNFYKKEYANQMPNLILLRNHFFFINERI